MNIHIIRSLTVAIASALSVLGAIAQGQVDTTSSLGAPSVEPPLVSDLSAQFPGGDIAMYAFIKQNLVYPEALKGSGRKGKVYVQFVVELDGSLSTIQIVRGVSPEMDAEAVRVVSLMPKWLPAEEEGVTSPTRFVLPIQFNP